MRSVGVGLAAARRVPDRAAALAGDLLGLHAADRGAAAGGQVARTAAMSAAPPNDRAGPRPKRC